MARVNPRLPLKNYEKIAPAQGTESHFSPMQMSLPEDSKACDLLVAGACGSK
jgi:hypothetical protein